MSTVSELGNALSAANTNNGNVTILLENGTYQLNSNLLYISSNMSNLTIRSVSGNRDSVIIQGLGMGNSGVTHIFNVDADNFTIADITIGWVYNHAVQLHAENDADNFTANNVRFVDIREQMLKVSGGSAGYSNDGKVYCCSFEFISDLAYQDYTGGIDAHRSADWEVKFNYFKNIRSPNSTLAEHAIHFWRNSSDMLVENNQIDNCDRGIGFGLTDDPGSGTQGGLVINNFVHCTSDVGIGLERSPDARVYHNTVVTENYSNSIEYRWTTTTNVHIANNLISGIVKLRDGASGTVESNVQISDYTIFSDTSVYDYHLTGPVTGITDNGINIAEADFDIDCEIRPYSNAPDIGADEYMPPFICHSVCTVTNGNDTGVGSLRGGLQCVDPGDTLCIDPATEGDTIELSTSLTINKSVVIIATQPFYINGTGLETTISIDQLAIVKIFGISILGSSSPPGMIINNGHLILEKVNVYGDENSGSILNNQGVLELKKRTTIY